MKKSLGLLLGLAVAILITVGALWSVTRGPAGTDGSGAPSAVLPLASAPAAGETGVGTLDPEAAPRMSAVEERRTFAVLGQVIDAGTQQPIPGAFVRAILPPRFTREGNRLRLAREFPHLVTYDGTQPTTACDWPRPEHIEAGALAVPLDPRNEILEVVISDAEGRFRLAIPESGWQRTLLEFEHEGHGARLRPTPSPDSDSPGSEPAPEMRVELFRRHTLQGQLVDEHDEPVAAALPLGIHTRRLVGEPIITERGFIDPKCIESLDSQLIMTADDGSFMAQVFGAQGSVSAITPEASDAVSFDTDASQEPLRIQLKPRLRLLFQDAESESPVEEVSLTLTSERSGVPFMAGGFFLRGGVLPLDHTWGYIHRESPMLLVAWSEAHAPTTMRLEDLTQAVEIEVLMEKGVMPSLSAHVVRGERPIADAEVALIPSRAHAWNPERLASPLTTASTDSKGAARLHAPIGTYILRVTPSVEGDTNETAAFFRVDLDPSRAEPVRIDLDTLASLHVRARIAGAAPTGQCGLVIDGPDGRKVQPFFDESGEIQISGIPPADYTLSVIDWGTGKAFPGHERRPLLLAPGERKSLALDLTPFEPIRCRVLHAGVADFTGWTASLNGRTDWQPVEPGGLLPQPVVSARQRFFLDDGQGRRFQFDLTNAAGGPAGEPAEFRLDRGTLGYQGTLEDPDGQPLSDHWIWAWANGGVVDPARPHVGAKTDAQGRFELRDLSGVPYVLRARDVDREGHTWVPRWQSLSYAPTELPSAAGAGLPLQIKLRNPTAGVLVRGTLVDRSGAPVRGVVYAYARYAGVSGTLRIRGNSRSGVCDANGEFELQLPVGVPCVVEGIANPFAGTVTPRAQQEVFLKSKTDVPKLRLVLP